MFQSEIEMARLPSRATVKDYLLFPGDSGIGEEPFQFLLPLPGLHVISVQSRFPENILSSRDMALPDLLSFFAAVLPGRPAIYDHHPLRRETILPPPLFSQCFLDRFSEEFLRQQGWVGLNRWKPLCNPLLPAPVQDCEPFVSQEIKGPSKESGVGVGFLRIEDHPHRIGDTQVRSQEFFQADPIRRLGGDAVERKTEILEMEIDGIGNMPLEIVEKGTPQIHHADRGMT